MATPFADLLPPLSTEEFDALKADIKTNGQRDPVLVDEDGNILDGHHRQKIDPKAKTRVIRGLTEAEKKAFVFRVNFCRRNLSPTQKAKARKQMQAVAKALRQEDAKKWTQTKVAGALGVARQTVAVWLAEKGMRNASIGITHTPAPDAKVKVPAEQKPRIVERINSGETQAQVAADYGINQSQVSRIVTAEKKVAETKKARASAAKKRRGDNGIKVADFRTVKLAAGSVDLILTDPPYDQESASLYEDLAAFAADKLVPGGWLLAYSGKAHLPDVMTGIAKHLKYAWTFCVLHTGGDARFRKFHVRTGWKPVVAAYRPPLKVDWDWFRDVVSGGKEKADHPWQQAVAEAAHFIAPLCPKRGIVCDPCCGSGTALLAAKQLDRRWIGYDRDKDAVATARSRLDDPAV